jgi:hypothetical protein
MKLLICILTCCEQSFKISDFTPIVAIAISIVALYFSISFSNKNVRLSIQQALLKLVLDKSFDCNNAWKKEPNNERNDNSFHYLVMTELIISTEIVNKSFDLFKKNYKSIMNYKDDYYYIFWKQLTPDLRGWAKRKCEEFGNSEDIDNDVYINQIKTIKRTFKKHFE